MTVTDGSPQNSNVYTTKAYSTVIANLQVYIEVKEHT
ncbi:hypothetical protein EV198_0323 [Roseivirga ehrenbergii]|nr:hypothetical protein EV198_0323 [Roseivirga ehrenbergii]